MEVMDECVTFKNYQNTLKKKRYKCTFRETMIVINISTGNVNPPLYNKT